MTTPYLVQGRDPVAWVTEAFARPLLAALEQRGGVPHSVRSVVGQQLTVRSPAQLRERVERRWFERFAHLSGQALLERADEIAVDLVAAPGCELSVWCEDGWLLDEDMVCMWCRPSGTVFDMTEEDGSEGRRSSPETAARMAAEIRASMRLTRRRPRSRWPS
jgi:hypothetical protein